MIHHITFSDNPKSNEVLGYEMHLPSLKGKTFTFTPGLNVIIGRNGCGKTSLLNVIRSITFCKGLFSSSFNRISTEPLMHLSHEFENGYWDDVTLCCCYNRSIWNLRKQHDFDDNEAVESVANMEQFLCGRRKSEGFQVMGAMNMMMHYMLYGYDTNPSKDIEKGADDRSFCKSVLNVIENWCKRFEDSQSTNNLHYTILSKLKNYYKTNKCDTSINEYSKYKGITVILDEPDKGMDVFNVKEVHKFLTKENSPCQIICVLHNIGMIHRLKQEGKANFIELSEGYMDSVEEYFK